MTSARLTFLLTWGLMAALWCADPSQAQTTSFLFSQWDDSGIANPLDEIIQWWPVGVSQLLHQTASNDVDWNPAEGNVDAWFVEHHSDEVGYFTPGTGTGYTDVFHLPVNYPKHVTLFDGYVYVSARNVGQVLKLDYQGNIVDSVDTGYTFGGQGMATDGTHLYVSSWTGTESTFAEYDADLNLIDTFNNPSGTGSLVNIFDFAYDADSGDFLGLAAGDESGTSTSSDTVLEFSMGGSVVNQYQLDFKADGIGQAPATTIPGDGNNDGLVNGLDYLIWADNYGTHPGLVIDPSNGDFNHDGWVDGLDYLIWAGNFTSVGSTSVPEPTAAALLLVALTAVFTRRIR